MIGRSSDKGTLLLLILLLFFALLSAGYVMKRGLEEGKKSQYESVWCVQIITSVVPPELPMQTALAVNTALIALLRAQIFCTEPYRVPLAGKLTHNLLRQDRHDHDRRTHRQGRGQRRLRRQWRRRGARSGRSAARRRSTSAEWSAAATPCCRSREALGDPIELAAIKGIGMTYGQRRGSPNSTTGRRRPRRRQKRRRRRRWQRRDAARPPQGAPTLHDEGDGGAQVGERGGAARPPGSTAT